MSARRSATSPPSPPSAAAAASRKRGSRTSMISRRDTIEAPHGRSILSQAARPAARRDRHLLPVGGADPRRGMVAARAHLLDRRRRDAAGGFGVPGAPGGLDTGPSAR